jgi:tetratricopeptide (TPR) repeat protein
MNMHKRLILILLAALLLVGNIAAAQDSTGVDCGEGDEATFVERGDLKFQAEDWEGAIFEYGCALALNPENLLALFGRGYSYGELREYTEAENDYLALLELQPDYGSANNNLGNIYYLRGDYERALTAYNQELELSNAVDLYITYHNRASLRLEMGDYALALEDAEEGLRLAPSYFDNYLVRARIYQTLGDDQSNADYAKWVYSVETQAEPIDFAGDIDNQTYPIHEGVVYTISVEAQAGQIIQAAARTNSDSQVDTLMLLEDADKTPVAGDDDSGVNLDAVLAYTVPENGTYRLLITHSNGGSEGEIKLTVTLSGEGAEGAAAEVFTDYSLRVDQTAVVYTTEGDRLNLRSGPGLTFDILEKLERDSRLILLEGPRRADGLAWWRVQTVDGVEGWAVERVDEEQTLQLALVLGDEAVITSTEGDTLRVRAGAGRDFEVVAQLEPGTVVTLLEGPQIVDDLSWWKISTADGIEGWAVERVEQDRTLTRQAETS